MKKIPVGISQCLLGEHVRYDGGHSHNAYLTDVLSEYFEYHSVCPEVAIGLGVPRKPIRLIATENDTRVVGIENPDLDVTDALRVHAENIAIQMPDICGYIFIKNSPSCGVFDIKRYNANGHLLDNKGQGAYAKRLMELMPFLPVEEAERLQDVELRENFIARVRLLSDWKQSIGNEPKSKK